MLIESETQGDHFLVEIREERLESSISSEFHQYVKEKAPEGIKTLIFNFESLNFIDSSGLGSIVAIKKGLPSDVDIRICCNNANVLNIFRLTRMDKVFKFYDNTSLALAA